MIYKKELSRLTYYWQNLSVLPIFWPKIVKTTLIWDQPKLTKWNLRFREENKKMGIFEDQNNKILVGKLFSELLRKYWVLLPFSYVSLGFEVSTKKSCPTQMKNLDICDRNQRDIIHLRQFLRHDNEGFVSEN